jgi:glycosyltransferase involved in cell wall biosynthesis
MIASIREGKGHRMFLDVAGRVTRERPDTRFIAVGGGPLRETLEAMATGLGDKVIFTGYRRDIPDVMSALDVVLLTSTHEIAPLCLMEAMAAGRPVVAAKAGCVEEVVVDGETGLLAKKRDTVSMARSVLSILNDPGLAAAMREAGRARARNEFTVGRMVGDAEALFEAVLDERPTS